MMIFRIFIFMTLFVSASFGIQSSSYLSMPIEPEEDEVAYQIYMNLDKTVKEFVDKGLKRMIPHFMDINSRLNLSLSCRKDALQLLSGVQKLKISALNFLDAFGKLPAGVLSGSLNMIGDYDQCLSSTLQDKNGNISFRGQYCFISIKPKMAKGGSEKLEHDVRNASELIRFLIHMNGLVGSFPFKYGLCVPSGCSEDDIEKVLNYISEKTFLNAIVVHCNEEEGASFPAGKIIAICMYSLAGLLLIIGTFLDYYANIKNIELKDFRCKLLLCFSVLKTVPKAIETKVSEHSLLCLNGIRVLSLFYVILSHHYLIKGIAPIDGHLLQSLEATKSFFFQIITNALLTVDVFFFLGGVVHVYALLKVKEITKKDPSFIQIMIYRLWRIYPTYIYCILAIYLMNGFRGPLKYSLQEEYTHNCDNNWWKNMLFINNFFNFDEMCIGHSWYLAVDTQLFLLSTIILAIFSGQPKKNFLLNIGMIITGVFSTIILAYYLKPSPAFFPNNPKYEDMRRTRILYLLALPHIAPYFIGIVIGYLLHAKKVIKISKLQQFIGWTTASVAFTSMLFLTTRWSGGVEYTYIESSLYIAFSRLLYISAIGWMVVCCAKGYGGVINYILSLKIWIPLSRISYMVYLTSPTLQMFYAGNIRLVPDSQLMLSIWRHMGDLLICCLLGFVMFVTLESPYVAMQKLIFFPKPPERKQNVEEHAEAHDNQAFNGKHVKSAETEMNNTNNINAIQENL